MISPAADTIQTKQKGFTLIELSIVLVIISLIVGGVLVGQNLVKSANIRAELSQIGRLNTAVNAFKDRFNGLPGDLPSAAATGMGILPFTNQNLGDGLIGDKNGAGILFDDEIAAATAQLAAAQLLDPGVTTGTTQWLDAHAAINGSTAVDAFMIPAVLGTGNSIWLATNKGTTSGATAFNGQQVNTIRIGHITAIAAGVLTDGANSVWALTPPDAAALDSKIDDGNPSTGNVVASNATTGDINLTTGAGKCSSASGVYDVVANPTVLECSLAIRGNF